MSIISIEQIQQLTNQFLEDVIQFRRHLHQYPELSFEEFETTNFIEEKLHLAGIETTRTYSDTGLVGFIYGQNPTKKCIALRADIDALPIVEQNEISYKSANEGVMHACGHDVHSANLYGTALVLNQLKSKFEGTIKLIFQPAEEKLPGGASLLIKNGVLNNPTVDAIFGLHVFPELEAGQVGFRPGLYMASADELHITIHGTGGHAALATNLKDPIEAMSHLLIELRSSLKSIAENKIPYVIGFGNVEAIGATNVIPDKVSILGTFRTMDEQWRELAHNTLQEAANSIAEQFEVEIEFTIMKGYPFLKNSVELTKNAIKWTKEVVNEQDVFDLPIRMSSEDFAFYTHHTKACFFRLGTSSKTNFKHSVHTPVFNIDEIALKTGMNVMSYLSIQELVNL